MTATSDSLEPPVAAGDDAGESSEPVSAPRVLLDRRWVQILMLVTGLAVVVAVPVLTLTIDPNLAEMARVRPYWLDVFADKFTEIGEGMVWIVPAFVLFVLFAFLRRDNLARWAFLMFAAVGGAGILVNLVKIVFGRYRPEELFDNGLYGFTWFAVGTPVGSFPSGHATTSGAAAVVLTMMLPRFWWFWLSMGAVVGATRLWTTDHYPSDIMAGLWFGAICALFAQWIWFKKSPHTLPV